MLQKGVVYRASGKVLVAGGYGVLEEGNLGLSLAVGNHFYSVTCIEEEQGGMKQQLIVEVHSPQLKAKWIYLYKRKEETIQQINKLDNIFVQKAVKYALEFSLTKTEKYVSKIMIKVLFDRGFLSETPQQRASNAKFLDYEPGTAKTGLGSSACVVVVVVGGIVKLLTEKWSQNDINVLSQVANIAAQNKIGSNFDISTAVFGSQLYTNVLPKKAFQAVEKRNLTSLFSIDPQVKIIHANKILMEQSSSWMIDLRRGSNTRTMVSGFIKVLHQQSSKVIQEFYNKNKIFVKEIEAIIGSSMVREELTIKLKNINLEYRIFLQNYSQITQIPVEPPEFNTLLDEIATVEGVVYCLCPGSGGYDAIFLLTLNSSVSLEKPVQRSVVQICKKHELQCEISRIDIEWSSQKTQKNELDSIIEYLQR